MKYEKPKFDIEVIESSETGDFNPADACTIIGAVITAGVIYAAAKC